MGVRVLFKNFKIEFIRFCVFGSFFPPPSLMGDFQPVAILWLCFKWFSFTNAMSLCSCSLLLEDPNVGTGGGEGGPSLER